MDDSLSANSPNWSLFSDSADVYKIMILVEGGWATVIEALRPELDPAILPELAHTLSGAAYARAFKSLAWMLLDLEPEYGQEGMSVTVEPGHYFHPPYGVVLGLTDPDTLRETFDNVRAEQRAIRSEDESWVPHDLFWPERDILCTIQANGKAMVGVPRGFVGRVHSHPEWFALLALNVAVTNEEDEYDDEDDEELDLDTLIPRLFLILGQLAPGFPAPVTLLDACTSIMTQSGKQTIRSILMQAQDAEVVYDQALDQVTVQPGFTEVVNRFDPDDEMVMMVVDLTQRLVAQALTLMVRQAIDDDDHRTIDLLLPHVRLLAATAIHQPDPSAIELITVLTDLLADEAPHEVHHYIQNLLATLDVAEITQEPGAPAFLDALIALARQCRTTAEQIDHEIGERLVQLEAIIHDHVRAIIQHVVQADADELRPDLAELLIHLSEFHAMPLDLRIHLVDRAVTLCEQHMAHHATDPAIPANLAIAEAARGNTLLATGNIKQAAEVYQLAAARLVEAGVITSLDDLACLPMSSDPLVGELAVPHLAHGWWVRGRGLLAEAEGDLQLAAQMLKQAFDLASMLVVRIPFGEPPLSRAIELQRDCGFLAGRLMLLAGDVPTGVALLRQSRLLGAPCAEVYDDRQRQIDALLSRSGP